MVLLHLRICECDKHDQVHATMPLYSASIKHLTLTLAGNSTADTHTFRWSLATKDYKSGRWWKVPRRGGVYWGMCVGMYLSHLKEKKVVVYHIHEEDICWHPLLPETQARVICYCLTGNFLLNNPGLHTWRLCSAYCLVYCHSELRGSCVTVWRPSWRQYIKRFTLYTHSCMLDKCSWRMRRG